jgi:hypothetical protein
LWSSGVQSDGGGGVVGTVVNFSFLSPHPTHTKTITYIARWFVT